MGRFTLRLEVKSDALAAQAWEIDQPVQVGRLPHLGISLPDVSLSRLHAELLPRETGWVVCDLGSLNGTYLNGEQLGRAETKIRRGDLLQFGKIILTVTDICDRTAPAAPAAGPAVTLSARLDWTTLPPLLAAGAATDPAWAEQLTQLLQIGRTCNSAAPLKSYLSSILWRVAEALDAPQSALIYFADPAEAPRPELTVVLDEGAGAGPWTNLDLPLQAVRARRSLLVQLPAVAAAPALSAVCVLLRVDARVLGVLCLGRLPEQPPFTEADLLRADALALVVAPSVQTLAELFERQERLFLKTLTALAQLVHLRDDRTGSHGQRTTDYALMLGEALQLAPELQRSLRVGTPLHDLGKIGIADAVLRKPGKLSAEEVQHVRAQILKGAELLEQLPALSPLLPIVRNTHEWWDGSGYPDGLTGTNIPLLARVVAVADAFDAMTTEQPYRKALAVHQALAELQARAGSQFDPECVGAFVQMRERLSRLVLQRREHTQTISMRELRQRLQAQADTAMLG